LILEFLILLIEESVYATFYCVKAERIVCDLAERYCLTSYANVDVVDYAPYRRDVGELTSHCMVLDYAIHMFECSVYKSRQFS
jgi:hypothetical protein